MCSIICNIALLNNSTGPCQGPCHVLYWLDLARVLAMYVPGSLPCTVLTGPCQGPCHVLYWMPGRYDVDWTLPGSLPCTVLDAWHVWCWLQPVMMRYVLYGWLLKIDLYVPVPFCMHNLMQFHACYLSIFIVISNCFNIIIITNSCSSLCNGTVVVVI